MNSSGFKVKGKIILDSHNKSVERTITVNGTPFGLMVGEFNYGGILNYAVKAEGVGSTWYQVGSSFPGIDRSKNES
jgi:hypothetical protein